MSALGTTPAFPQGNTMSGGNNGGMTLRDWFAGQALAGLMSQIMADRWGQLLAGAVAVADERARLAYIAADAMLAKATIK